eukprot:SAG31_NODE_25983_length_450_cov_1.452991_1_plen_21_part_10
MLTRGIWANKHISKEGTLLST